MEVFIAIFTIVTTIVFLSYLIYNGIRGMEIDRREKISKETKKGYSVIRNKEDELYKSRHTDEVEDTV